MNIENFYNTKEQKRFYFPGRIISGKNSFDRAIELCQESEGEIVLIIDAFVFELELIQDAIKRLSKRLRYVKKTNGSPYSQDIQNFVAQIDQYPSVILSIGGGSATDFAKAVIASYLLDGFDGIGMNGNFKSTNGKVKPLHISVPTTAGSGAEASRYYVTYDINDSHKIHGKNWNLISDWIILDPEFMYSLSNKILITCAFDVFVHLFESLICRFECSWINQMLSINTMQRLMHALDKIINHDIRDDSVFTDLLEAACIGGMAISNVRTGNIHEAAGALLEKTNLTHPETLFVFFRAAVEQYQDEIKDKEAILLSSMRLNPLFEKFVSVSDIISWWEKLFADENIHLYIVEQLAKAKENREAIKKHVYERVYSDKVWVSKESPILVSDYMVEEFIEAAFNRFGLRACGSQ